jgi:hypothetical protein
MVCSVDVMRQGAPWLCLVLCSCGESAVGPRERTPEGPPSGLPDDPAEYTIFTFDGLAGDEQVRLQWDAEIFYDYGPPPPPPPLSEVRVWMSVVGPSEGF